MNDHQTITGIYPGTFDPVTFGHLDIVERACNIVDKLIAILFLYIILKILLVQVKYIFLGQMHRNKVLLQISPQVT